MLNDESSSSPFEDEASSNFKEATNQNVSRDYLSLKNILIVTIVLLNCAGNVVIPGVVWDLGSRGPRELAETAGMFFVGALAAQIGLLAAGVAFARGSILAAITRNSLLTVFVSATYVLGLRRMGEMPLEGAIFLFAVGLGAFVVTAGCLLVVRWYWRVKIDLNDEPVSDSHQPPAKGVISIRYLMLTTAAIALTICVIRWSIPSTSSSSGATSQLYEFAIMCGLETVESIFVFLLCLQLALARWSVQRFGWSLATLVAFSAIFPFLNAVLVQFFTRELIYQYLHLAYAYIAGLAFFSILTLLLLRLVGYRLNRTVA